MSPRLPNITAKEAASAFAKAGFKLVGQRGSHARMKNAEGVQIVIPMHTGDIKRPLLKAAIKQAGLTETEFRKLL
ncbi:MAG: YcfA family protein [Parcubacteria group bacterium GW2011_GWA2_51_10]|nr:MAG: YcfA family protein [Parcubacteria group bacterium GW2011_GWA2_51_10]